MMEFTYNGMVRWGFGFENPNHAATLFCAILPLLWGWKKYPYLGIFLSACLIAALVFTCSRTGLLVLCLELAVYAVVSERKNWKWLVGLFLFALVCTGTIGLFGRFTLDGAITNRPQIWLSGLKLYAANIGGVGAGNSGRIASAFLLPEEIQCRTLVNSHLTLLTEYGIFAGLLWFTLWFYALLTGFRKKRVWIALTGLFISAAMSTIFDGGSLFVFQPASSNFWMAWLLLLFCFALLLFCIFHRIVWKQLGTAFVIALFICLVPCILYTPDTPRVQEEYLVKNSLTSPPLLIYDSEWTLRDLRPFCADGGILALQSGFPKVKYKGHISRTLYFGEVCANAADSAKPFYFVSPSEFVRFPHGLAGVFLPQFGNTEELKLRLKEAKIPVLPMP